MAHPIATGEEKVVYDAGEGNNLGLGGSAGTGGTSGLPHDGGIRRDDEIRVVDEPNHHAAHHGTTGEPSSRLVPTEHASNAGHPAPQAGGTHDGLNFGEKWDPASDIAANVRRSQIMALASSRAEKGAQDELLPDRRSSLAKLDEERRYSGARDPDSHDDRIRALAHSRSEAGHHQNELQPHENSSQAKLDRERQHSASVPKDDIDGRIRALASSRSEKNSHQNELLPDRRSSIQLAEDNRKHSLSYPAENPRKSSITPFVSEEKRQEARKASIGGLEGADHIDTDPKDSARRSSVAAGLATYAAGTGQSLGSGQQDPTPSPLGTHGSGTDTRKVDVAPSRAEAGDARHVGQTAGIVGGGSTAHEAHPGSERPIGGVGVGEQRGVEHAQEHHHGRDAALGGAAVGAASYAGLEEERQREWKREQQVEKEQHEREKEQKKREKEAEHEHKKHEHEVKKAEKEHEKEVKKLEKEHEKEIKKADKHHEQEQRELELEERRRHEREAAGVVAGGAGGVGAYEAVKHHEHGAPQHDAPQHGVTQPTSTTAAATEPRLDDLDVRPGPGAEAYHGTRATGGVTADRTLDTENRHQNREAAIIGGGVAGTAATAGYEAEEHRHRGVEETEERHKDEKDDKTEKRSSFLGGLFGRGKDDKKEEDVKKEPRHEDKDREERRREEHAKLLQSERKDPEERLETQREERATTSGHVPTAEDESGHTKLHKEPPADVQQKLGHIANQQVVTDPVTGLPKDLSKAEPGLARGTDGLP